MTQLQIMHDIAQRVRKEMEDPAFRRRCEKWAGYKITSRLGGLCGRASGRIVTYARKAGITATRTETWCGGHVFVRWRGWLIDVTATQFNSHRPKVVFIRESEIKHRPWYWKTTA